MEAFLAGWGRRNDQYDERVLEVISHPEYMDAVGLEALKSRLREDPSLIVQQYAWYQTRLYLKSLERNANTTLGSDIDYSHEDYSHEILGRPMKQDSPWVMELAYQTYFVVPYPSETAKIVALIDVAAVFNRPELILSLTMDNLDEQWAKEKAWLRDNAR